MQSGKRILTEWKVIRSKQADRLPFAGTEPPSSPSDLGFRAFKLDSSNLQKWDCFYVALENADLFLDRAGLSLDNMKPDRRDIEMVYKIFLKYGVPLTEKPAALRIRDKTFYSVGDSGYLMIFLDKALTAEIMEKIIKTHTPGTVIFADA